MHASTPCLTCVFYVLLMTLQVITERKTIVNRTRQKWNLNRQIPTLFTVIFTTSRVRKFTIAIYIRMFWKWIKLDVLYFKLLMWYHMIFLAKTKHHGKIKQCHTLQAMPRVHQLGMDKHYSMKIVWWWPPGPCLHIKKFFLGIGISIIKIGRSWDRPIFIMGIHTFVRRYLDIDQGLSQYDKSFHYKDKIVRSSYLYDENLRIRQYFDIEAFPSWRNYRRLIASCYTTYIHTHTHVHTLT